MLKNMKMKDPNVVEIDLLFLFVVVSVLCVWIRTNVGFLVKKTLVLGGTNKKTVWCSPFFDFFRWRVDRIFNIGSGSVYHKGLERR